MNIDIGNIRWVNSLRTGGTLVCSGGGDRRFLADEKDLPTTTCSGLFVVVGTCATGDTGFYTTQGVMVFVV